MKSIILLVKGIICLAIGIVLLPDSGTREFGILLTILGICSLGLTVKKLVTPATVGGGLNTSRSALKHETVSQIITDRRVCMPRDSRPQIPFEL